MALKSKQAGGLSDRGIAEHCGVGPELVAEVRRLVFDSNTVAATTRKAKDGRVIKADSDARSKAGKASAAKKAETKAAQIGGRAR